MRIRKVKLESQNVVDRKLSKPWLYLNLGFKNTNLKFKQ